MTESSSGAIAAKAKAGWDAHVAAPMRELNECIDKAIKVAKAITSSGVNGSWIEWEYRWLADVGVAHLDASSLDFDGLGVYFEYTPGQGYPEEGFLPFALLDDPEGFFKPFVAEATAAKAARDAEWKARERERLLRQLAHLDARE